MADMHYFVEDRTLVIRGKFNGVSTGINGGRKKVKAIVNHQVNGDFNHDDPAAIMDEIAARLGVKQPYFGFMTAVYMENLCIVRDPFITTFVTAGISNPCHDPSLPGTINVIVVVHGRMSEGALAGAIITATEAKAKALFDMGFDFTGTTTDAVAIVTEERKTGVCEPPYYEYSGTSTPIGQSIYRCVKKGVEEGIRRQHPAIDNKNHRSRLFVYAVGNDGPYWIEYPNERQGKDRCPYYPCHSEGQDCTYCYCPLYPCEDPELGEWIKSSRGYPVWTCKDCTLLHHKKAVEHLAKHPGASTKELKALK
ncbi:MAG: adenosylcobinamide amidohydrolase [Actinomycetota bacterium]